MSDYEKQSKTGATRTIFPVPKKPLADVDTCACVKYSLQPADFDATENTKELLRSLYDMSKRKSVMFGQQNAGLIGVSISRTDGTDSDV